MARSRDAALNVKIGGSSAAFEAAMNRAASRLKSFGDQMKNIGQNLSTYVTAPLAALGGLSVKAAAKIESAEVAFTGLLKSAQKASIFVKDLMTYAANTPFRVDGLMQSSRLLLTFGFEADRIIPIMRTLGDAVAAMGGGSAELEGVSRALGQIRAKGKVSAEELMQLAERGIPAYEILQQKLGLTAEQVADIGNQGIKADLAINAILAGLQEKFTGAAAAQAGTLTGLWSTAVDNISISMAKLGQVIVKTFNLKGAMQAFITGLQNLTERFEKLSPSAQRTVVIMGALAAAVGPVVFAIGTLSKAVPVFASGLRAISVAASPVVLTIGAIAAAVIGLGLVLKSAYDAFEGFRKVVNYVIDSVKVALQGWYDTFKTVFGPIVNFLDNAFGGALGRVKGAFDDAFSSDAAKDFGKAFMDNLSAIKEGVSDVFGSIVGEAGKAGEQLGNALTGGLDKFEVDLSDAVKRINLSIQKIGLGAGIEKYNNRTGLEETPVRRPGPPPTITTTPVSGLPQRTTEDLEKVLAVVDEKTSKFKYITQEAQMMSESVQAAVTEMAVGVADALGDMFAGLNSGGNPFAAFGKAIFSTLAKVAQQLGKTAIAIGVGVEGIKTAIMSMQPAAAIIGGIALIAIGKLLQSGLSNMVPALAVGTSMVKSDGLAQLHKGEAVVPASVVNGGFARGMGGANFVIKPINVGRELMLFFEQQQGYQNAKFGG